MSLVMLGSIPIMAAWSKLFRGGSVCGLLQAPFVDHVLHGRRDVLLKT